MALQPWSAYELAQEMHHCFDYFWQRTDSRSYAEAERLVNYGLASATKKFTGKRARTTYSITPRGRTALKRWLANPPSQAFELEFEGLVRVFLGRSGTKEQVLSALDKTRDEAEGLLEFAAAAAQHYYDGNAPFQEEESHLRAFVFTFMVPYAKNLRRWADQTRAEIESWEDLSADGKAARALEVIRSAWEPD